MAKDNPALDELRKMASAPAAEPEPAEEKLVDASEVENREELQPEPVEQASEPAPEPEPQAAAEDDKPAGMPPGLREERDKRKAAQAETQNLRAENDQLQAQMRALHEQMQAIQQSLNPKDDKPADPVADDP